MGARSFSLEASGEAALALSPQPWKELLCSWFSWDHTLSPGPGSPTFSCLNPPHPPLPGTLGMWGGHRVLLFLFRNLVEANPHFESLPGVHTDISFLVLWPLMAGSTIICLDVFSDLALSWVQCLWGLKWLSGSGLRPHHQVGRTYEAVSRREEYLFLTRLAHKMTNKEVFEVLALKC